MLKLMTDLLSKEFQFSVTVPFSVISFLNVKCFHFVIMGKFGGRQLVLAVR